MITEKAEQFQENIRFIDYAKAFDYVDHNKLWRILQEIGIPDYLIYLLRNLYAGQEAIGELDTEQLIGSKLGKEYVRAVYSHSAYLTFMQNTSCKMLGWVKQAGIKIAGRNIKNLRYTDDTILMAESEEEIKTLLMKVKEKS